MVTQNKDLKRCWFTLYKAAAC